MRAMVGRDTQLGKRILKEWTDSNYRAVMLTMMAIELGLLGWIALVDTIMWLRR